VPSLFVDTGAFYALADRSDGHHLAARTAWLEGARTDELVTTDHVVVESWLLLRARLGRRAAMHWWDALARGAVTVVGVTSQDFARARDLADAWPDQDSRARPGITAAFGHQSIPPRGVALPAT
jgi:predicted nucleic acid-binding protein